MFPDINAQQWHQRRDNRVLIRHCLNLQVAIARVIDQPAPSRSLHCRSLRVKYLLKSIQYIFVFQCQQHTHTSTKCACFCGIFSRIMFTLQGPLHCMQLISLIHQLIHLTTIQHTQSTKIHKHSKRDNRCLPSVRIINSQIQCNQIKSIPNHKVTQSSG